MLDSGATHCFCSDWFARQSGFEQIPSSRMHVRLATGVSVDSDSVVRGEITLAHGVVHSVECHVVPELAYPLILGLPWLRSYNPSVDW